MQSRTLPDQLGNEVSFPFPPRRIVSLVPSQTELLYALGLDEQVKGITRFCVHPPHWKQEKMIIGGTKNFHLDQIVTLAPDLILGNKEENYQEGIEQLRAQFPVWVSDVISLPDALGMIASVGFMTDREDASGRLIREITNSFEHYRPRFTREALYLIWSKPWMAAGSNTFINTMMQVAGFVNVLEGVDRYPALTDEDLRTINPEILLLSTEPFPFNEEYVTRMKEILPDTKVLLVDGKMFSWYGSRLLEAAHYFRQLQERIVLL